MITPEKIRQFIEGNLKLLGDQLNILPKHIKEQVIWRSQICSDCMDAGQCKYCGCDVPGKLYVSKSCNDGDRFPDIMDKGDWLEYKQLNNIEINLDEKKDNTTKDYEILLSGSGVETYLFELNNEQVNELSELNLNTIGIFDLLERIGHDNLESASSIMTGSVDHGFTLNVTDEENNKVFLCTSEEISPFNRNFQIERVYGESAHQKETHLVYENKIKGDILRFQLSTSEEFDINKLKLVFTYVGYRNILTNIIYDDEYIFLSTDYLKNEFIGTDKYLSMYTEDCGCSG
jgi:hypothetical protein